MPRSTQRDWWEAGLRLIAETGAEGLTVEALTATMGLTKGSFYHHFATFQEYRDSLLSFFERYGTLNVIGEVEEADSDREKLIRLIDVVSDRTSQLEVGIRAWALQDDEVRAYQERIDTRRLAYLQELCTGLIDDEVQASLMAHSFYALYVGCQQIIPPLEGAARRRLLYSLLQLYGVDEPPGNRATPGTSNRH